MEVGSLKDYEKLEVEVQTNESLRDNFTIRKGAKLKPKVIIHSVNEKLEAEEIVTGY